MERQKFRLPPMVMSLVFILCSIFSMLMLCPNPVYAADPEVTFDNPCIYANGNAITLKANPANPNNTLIYFDSDLNTPVQVAGLIADAEGGYNLAATQLFGGSKTDSVSSTSITMLGGKVNRIYGGGNGKSVDTDTHVTVSGGEVFNWVYGGGLDAGGTVNDSTYVTISGTANISNGDVCGSGYNDKVNGSANVTVTGGNIRKVFGAGASSGSDVGSINISITGGNIGSVDASGGFGNVTNKATVEIGVDAAVSGSIRAGSPIYGALSSCSLKYEVAYYDGTTKLSDPAPEWVEMVIGWGGWPTTGTATLPTTVLTGTGKTFAGWKKADGTNFDGTITSPQKIYAGWEYPVTYNGNGNTGGTVPTDSNTYAAGANVPLAGNTGNLTKTGYTFGGWSTTANGTAVTTYTMGSAPVTFYAVWKTTPADNGNNNNSSNNNSSSTTTTSRAPSLETGGGQTIVGALEAAKSGTTVEVNMNDSTMLQGDWMKAIAGKDVNLVLDMGGGVKWTINGKNVSGTSFSSVNLGVFTSTSCIPGSVVNKVSGERKTVQFTITHNGSFGFTAALSVGLGKENKGLFANLYYYNETTQKMEFQSASKIGEDGSAAWEFKHASSYAVVIDKASHATELSAGAAIEDTAMALNTVNNQ